MKQLGCKAQPKKKTKMLHDFILKTYLIRSKTHWKETDWFLRSSIEWNINIRMKYLVFAKLTIEWNIIIWNDALGFGEVHIRKQKDLKNQKKKNMKHPILSYEKLNINIPKLINLEKNNFYI